MSDEEVARLNLLATLMNLQVNIDILNVSKKILAAHRLNTELLEEVLKDVRRV